MSGMRIPKKIRELPWPENQKEIQGPEKIEFYVTAENITADGAEWLIVTFVPCKGGGCAFRYVLSKERGWALLLNAEGTGPRTTPLQKMLRYYWDWPNLWMKKQDEETIARWIGSKEKADHYMPALDAWMREDAEKRLEARRKANGEIEDGEEHLCPEELPEGIEDYIRRTVLPEDATLLYKKGGVRGLCYICGREVRAAPGQKFRKGEQVKCPHCGSAVTAALANGAGFRSDYVENIASISKGTDGKTVFVRLWHLRRDYTAKWENIPGQLQEITRWAIRGNKVAKWEHEHKFSWGMACYREGLRNWEKVNTVTEILDYKYYFYLPTDWRTVFAGTGLRYCEPEQYLNQERTRTTGTLNPIRFLLDWARYPAIELFWKAGYRELVNGRMRSYCYTKEANSSINWRRKSIGSAARFPKRYLKLIQPEEWSLTKAGYIVDMINELGELSDKNAQTVLQRGVSAECVKEAAKHASLTKVLNYLKRWDQFMFRDYISECLKLKLDLNDRAVLFPKNLRSAHERTSAMVEYENNPKQWDDFVKRAKKLKKYAWNMGDLMIRVAEYPTELKVEGAALGHCVAGYAKDMANGKTSIFFVRRTAEPDKPYFTLEYKNGMVAQCRTNSNVSYESFPEVKAFVEAWCEWLGKSFRNGLAAGVPAA